MPWNWGMHNRILLAPFHYTACRSLVFLSQKIQYGRLAAILKVTSLKINRLLPMATINMHMKFEIEIPRQTWLMLRKPCRLQTDGQTDGRTDKVNPVYPPSNFVGRGYKDLTLYFGLFSFQIRWLVQMIISSLSEVEGMWVGWYIGFTQSIHFSLLSLSCLFDNP